MRPPNGSKLDSPDIQYILLMNVIININTAHNEMIGTHYSSDQNFSLKIPQNILEFDREFCSIYEYQKDAISQDSIN